MYFGLRGCDWRELVTRYFEDSGVEWMLWLWVLCDWLIGFEMYEVECWCWCFFF